MRSDLLPSLLVGVLCIYASAQQSTTISKKVPIVETDGFPLLPKFAVNGGRNPHEKKQIADQIKYLGLTIRTPIPFKRDDLSAYPKLGPMAFEILSKEPIWGKFAMASVQDSGHDLALNRWNNLGLIRFDKSLNSKQMFYRRQNGVGIFHSPLFSPNGRTLFFRDGIPAPDVDEDYNGVVWNFAQAKLSYIRLVSRSAHLIWSPGSRFISLILGGESSTSDSQNFTPQRLYCLDTKKQALVSVQSEPGLCWSWTYDAHLLCAHIPRNAKIEPRARPSVYRVSARGGKSQKLFDGGYYAHQSPDGKNIVFCDWAGELVESENAADNIKKNTRQGLFVWNTKRKARTFLGSLPIKAMLPPRSSPQIVWSNDNRTVFVLVSTLSGSQVIGHLYKTDILAKTCKVLGQISFIPEDETRQGWFEPRLALSPNEKKLYVDAREKLLGLENSYGPMGSRHSAFRYTLWTMNTANGTSKPLARLTNLANENPDWDFHDDSGLNPACVAAEQRENTLH